MELFEFIIVVVVIYLAVIVLGGLGRAGGFQGFGASAQDIGEHGEWLVYKALEEFERDGSKLLWNVYIPTEYGKTTEIDMILITKKGVIVIESKNYSGWIFGNERNTNWTQTFPAGYGRSHKFRFYNPIRQNNNHIKQLARLIQTKVPYYFSIVVFSDECTLKDITINSQRVTVLYQSQLNDEVERMMREERDIFSQMKVEEIYNQLLPYADASDEIKERHIDHVSKYSS